MFKYIEVRRDSNNETVMRMDVTGKTERQIDKLLTAVFNRIDINNFHVDIDESPLERPKI